MAKANVINAQFDFDKLSRPAQIDLMEEYYNNNNLYESTRILKYLLGVWEEDKKPLRTPVHRSVEFYVAKICVGDAKVSAKSQQVTDAVNQILEWSNFNIVKPLQLRTMSKLGDLFRRVVSDRVSGKVWHEIVETKEVTDYTEDARGFITSIRIDTPIDVDGQQKIRTEYWTANAALPYMAIWEHLMDENTPLDQLGDPIFSAFLSDFGIDFVPFTRSPFANIGKKWGASCVQHALVKIDEANRQATKLHQTLYRYGKPTWVVSAGYMNPDGSPGKVGKVKSATDPNKKDIEVRDNTILYLDGVAKIDSLIPNIDYKAALEVLLSQEKELEKDMPELLYFSLPDKGIDPSGKALQTILGAAIDRAVQAQANYVEGTVRLNQMAITIGQFLGIISVAGTFDGGELAHTMKFSDPFPTSMKEKSEILKNLKDALGAENLKKALAFAGFTEEEIAGIVIPQPIVPNNPNNPANPANPNNPAPQVA